MLVSIIIPTYNRLGPVQRAIDSVLRQSYKNIELIVVDDGSTDGTDKWLAKINDERFRYFHISHGGVARARNYGVSQSKADWICFLDSDDVWHRHKLSHQLHFHADHPEILISQTDDIWVRNSTVVNKMKKHEVREGHLFEDSLKLCLICCSSVMLKKSLFLELEGFDETLETCEDYDLWLRILAHHPVGFVHKKLVTKFGGHEDQLSKAFSVMDQYRVYSLKKLLQNETLTIGQKKLVEEELIKKQDIIEAGKRKREST